MLYQKICKLVSTGIDRSRGHAKFVTLARIKSAIPACKSQLEPSVYTTSEYPEFFIYMMSCGWQWINITSLHTG